MTGRDTRATDASLPAGRTLAVPGAALLILAGLWAYHNSLWSPFFFDDDRAIVNNLHIRRLWPLWDALRVPPDNFLAGRPVSALSLAVNYALGGLHVFGYHAFNLALHLANTLLLWRITVFTLGRTRLASASGPLALSAALLWTVHPLLTDAVTYLAQRTELLMSFWLLATLYCVIRSVASAAPYRWQAAAVIACALGTGSKQVMIVAPALVALYDWLFLASGIRDMARRRWLLYAGLAASWLLLAGLMRATDLSNVVGFHFRELTPWDYLRTQTTVIWRYLQLSVWPHPLVIDYWDWPIARSWAPVAVPALGLAALLALTVRLLLRKHPLGFIGAWCFLILGPSSSILPIASEIVAERRMYLPLYPLILAAVTGIWQLLSRAVRDPRRRGLAAAWSVGLLVLLLGTLTLQRNVTHHSVEALWRDTIRKRPDNARAHTNLSVELLRRGRGAEALAESIEVVRIAPDHPEAYYALGLIFRRLGLAAEAAACYHETIRLSPRHAPAHNSLGVLLIETGRTDEAMAHYWQAIRYGPTDPNPRNNLGVAFETLGLSQPALDLYRQAIRLSPGHAQARENLRRVLERQQGGP